MKSVYLRSGSSAISKQRSCESMEFIVRPEDRYRGGSRIPPAGIDALKGNQPQFLPATLPEGIIDFHLQERYTAFRPGVISGVTHRQRSDSAWIVLSGPGGKEDLSLVRGKGKQNFKLTITPKTSGRIIYTITNDTRSDTIPLNVHAQRRLNIL